MKSKITLRKVLLALFITVLTVSLVGCSEDEIAIQEIEDTDNIEIEDGVTKDYLIENKLPESLEVTITDGEETRVKNPEVVWQDVDDYNPDSAGSYTFQGSFTIEDSDSGKTINGVEHVNVVIEEDFDPEEDEIIDFTAVATENMDELEFSVDAHAQSGIEKIEISSSIGRKAESFAEERVKFEGIIDAAAGPEDEVELEEIEVAVETGEGHKMIEEKEVYVRRYDVYESEDDIKISAMYWPFMEPHWNTSSTGEPLIGPYYLKHNLFQHGAVSRHIDQMQSSGISRMSLLFGQTENDIGIYENLADVELVDEIYLELEYDVDKVIKRDLDVDSHMEFFREEMISRENYYRKEGRPMILFWASHSIARGEHREKVDERWGGPVEFIDHIRSELTVHGIEPYMVGDFQHVGHGYYKHQEIDDQILEIMQEFDAVTTWTGNNKTDETIDWEEQFEFVKQNFRGYEKLTDNYDIEFAPRVFPGFDDRGNINWGEDRLTPPDPGYFADMLELADEYRTIDYINVASWSEWAEGHMIEPGYYFDYEEYPHYEDGYFGFDYLDEIKDFLD